MSRIDFEIIDAPLPGLDLIEAIRGLKVNTHIAVKCETIEQANHYRTVFLNKVRAEGQRDLHSRLMRGNGTISLCFFREPVEPAGGEG